jgi:predicted transcriptional regulator of viral defense system
MSDLKIGQAILNALSASPHGITTLDVLESLRLSDSFTLKTILSRLNRSGRIIHLKRGVYSTKPMTDPYACAQATFNGYLGFSTALHLHGLISEMPFTLLVATTSTSKVKRFGEYEFRAVALGEKAVGFARVGNYVVSTRPKTLFDCLYLPKYSVEEDKLLDAFGQAKLTKQEWREFDVYVKKFTGGRIARRIEEAEKSIRRG